MRLHSMRLAGFRGFAAEKSFDLDADVVVVVGANGNGKTSFFDAILWAISGRVLRLGSEDSVLLCKYSETGQARVVLQLTKVDGSSPITITRVFDGKETKVSVETPDGILSGPEAEGRLIQLVWSEAAKSASPAEALSTALTRSVYLQQDLIRQFIDSATEQDRFNTISELVGTGRVTDLQGELERAKAAWTRTTNSKSAELEPLRKQASTMEFRLNELKARPAPTESAFDETAWSKWWDKLQEHGLEIRPVRMASREAAGAIDAVINQLDAIRRASERRRQVLDELKHDFTSLAEKPKPDINPLQEKVALYKQQRQQTREAIAAEQARMAEVRRQQVDLQEKSEQLRALASLALKHLGERCPICDQTYDIESTRRRMESLAAVDTSDLMPPLIPDALPGLIANLDSQEKELSVAELELHEAEKTTRDRQAAELAIERRFEELGLNPLNDADQLSAVNQAVEKTQQEVAEFTTMQKSGEAFAFRISQAGDQATIQELQREIEASRAKLLEEEHGLASREETGELAQQMIAALREAAFSVVTERVKEIEPLLIDIYSRIDVHPTFRLVNFLASVMRGRGQLSTVVYDPIRKIECTSPGTILSSSQINALAVCIFLSLNLGVSQPPLETVILDDPLQSLDDINLLGLFDLLRRTKEQRQLCVSTHNARFGTLLARKLRPRSPDQRTIVIELDGWSRTGPTVTTRDVNSDPVPLRLVASSSLK